MHSAAIAILTLKGFLIFWSLLILGLSGAVVAEGAGYVYYGVYTASSITSGGPGVMVACSVLMMIWLIVR